MLLNISHNILPILYHALIGNPDVTFSQHNSLWYGHFALSITMSWDASCIENALFLYEYHSLMYLFGNILTKVKSICDKRCMHYLWPSEATPPNEIPFWRKKYPKSFNIILILGIIRDYYWCHVDKNWDISHRIVPETGYIQTFQETNQGKKCIFWVPSMSRSPLICNTSHTKHIACINIMTRLTPALFCIGLIESLYW